MFNKLIARPAICLNMIVRNEAHVVAELLDSVAPYITSWVIVDTGSNDGTQDLIRSHMTRLGIPGRLYERPWHNFGYNRTEALNLAQGRGDYIWVMDADDILVGTPDFTQLDADMYLMRFRGKSDAGSSLIAWRLQLFRDGLRVRYEGDMHEQTVCDDPAVTARIEGGYHIEYRKLGARSLDPQTPARDLDKLLAAVERNPQDAQLVLHLAQTYFVLGDYVNARKWYERRVEMGGPDEFVFHAMCQVASSMSRVDATWPEVQDALLRASEFRPSRAEALVAIALRYRAEKRYWLAYQFAKLAAEIPFPEKDLVFVDADVYAYRATEEQAVCAGMLGMPAESFTLFRDLVARPGVPDDQRQRIAGNRDVCAPAMADAALVYPNAVVQRLVAGLHRAEVVVSFIAGPDRHRTERALNSFLQCCTDVTRVHRFLAVDAGLSAQDKAVLQDRYGFLEFAPRGPGDGAGAQLGQIRAQINGRFWLHLGDSWEFFAPENFIGRLTAVLDAEAQVFQVGINFADAVRVTNTCAAEQSVRRAPDTGRYVLTDQVAYGPAMFDTARLDQAGGVDETDADPIAGLARRAAATGLRTATLDEVSCVAPVQRVRQHAQPIQVKDRQPEPAMSKEMSTGNNGPIFIGGAGRSGTTLMRVMLDAHPRICCGPEMKLLPNVADLYQWFTHNYFRSVMIYYGNTSRDVQGYFRTFIEALVENFRRAEGKPRWAEKTPNNVKCMVSLGEIFPEARFIHMVRDGRDVACSLVTRNWPDPETGQKLDLVETVAGAARYWRENVMAGRRQAEDPRLAGRVLEVRYEALVTETAATMRQVLAFLGEEWDDAVLSHHTKDRTGELLESSTFQILKPVNQTALGRWRQDMTPDDKADFKAEAGALLTALGYATADW